MGLEILFKLRHDLTRELIEVGTGDTKILIGLGNLKVGKDRWLHRGVVGTASVNQAIIDVMALRLGACNGPDNWSHLDEIGACSTNDANIHNLQGLGVGEMITCDGSKMISWQLTCALMWFSSIWS